MDEDLLEFAINTKEEIAAMETDVNSFTKRGAGVVKEDLEIEEA
jgi:hypothetical protein